MLTMLPQCPCRFYSFSFRSHVRSISTIATKLIQSRHSTIFQQEMPGQGFERLLVLDFEATCDSQQGVTIHPQEVIEFPVLCLDVTQDYQLKAKFHRYVRPEIYPILTPFCTKLTGIIQDMVDHEATLPAVLHDLHQWLMKENLLNDKVAFVTCGDWDLRTLLPNQCRYLGLEVPVYFKSWINIKMIFAETTGVFPRNLPHMLSHFGLPQLGRLHSGIDDCTNIAAVIRRLRLEPNCVWRLTSFAQD